MNLIPLYIINSTVCGHLIVAWAMALNAVAYHQGGAYGAAGVACGMASLALAWLASGRSAVNVTQGETDKATLAMFSANGAFTFAAWLLWLVPALTR